MSDGAFETEETAQHIPHPDVVAVSSEAHQDESRLIPIEDFGTGVVRLIGGGFSGLAALGKGDALPTAIKKISGDVETVVNKAVQTVSGLLNRSGSAKE